MYLVEEFKDALHLKLPLRSLEQAISNVQASPVLRLAVHQHIEPIQRTALALYV